MKILKPFFVTAGVAGLMCLGAGQALAQGGGGGFGGGGNFDPAQFRQQMQKMLLDNYRNQLTITNDAEWGVIQEKIQKVLEARQETGFGGMGGMIGMFGRGPRPGGDTAAPGPAGAGRRGLAAFGGTPNPEEEALQKAIDSGASNPELKAALAKLIEARKARQAKLEKAQDELRQVLSVRQEAIVSLGGLL